VTFDKNVVLLVGGVGGAKLAYGLYKTMPPERLTVIVNTGDDFWLYGLRICPDLDTITYTLSGLVNPATGWGIQNDTTTTLSALERIGEAPWFRLGDQDLATHMLRTQLWHEGYTLTEITRRLTSVLGIECAVLPMADTPVETHIDTVERGELSFQLYFVKHRWQPTVRSINLHGIEQATVSDAVADAIAQADAIIIGPSNPWLSIKPILDVPGLKDALRNRDVPRISVTPLIKDKAVKGPTAKIMRELGYPVTVKTVVETYRDIINGFVIDQRDTKTQITDIPTLAIDTLMDTQEKRVTVAQKILTWLENWTS